MSKLLFTSLMGFLIALLLWSLAWHSLDTAFNMVLIEKELGYDLYDISLFGGQRDSLTIYNHGRQQLYLSMCAFILSWILAIRDLYRSELDKHLKIKNIK